MAVTADDLRRVDLFAELDDRDRKSIASAMRERTFSAGQTVTEEGGSGVGFFLIEDGSATVSVNDQEVRTLGAGDYFGELAMISRRERNATVTTDATTRCLVIAFADFRQFVQQNPDVAWKLLEHLADVLAAARAR